MNTKPEGSTNDETSLKVTDNPGQSRFESEVDGHTAVLEYSKRHDGVLILTHTEVPKELSGRGIGSQLVRAALETLRRDGKKIVPLCPYVAAFIQRHPEYEPMVAR